MSGIHLLVLAPVAQAEKERFEAAAETVIYGEAVQSLITDRQTVINKSALTRINAVFGFLVPEGVEAASDLPNLRWWMSPTAGADFLISTPFFKDPQLQSRLTLTSNSGVHCTAIPPYVIAMAISLLQRNGDDLIRQHTKQQWVRRNDFYMKEMYGSTWGILGYGRIGREVARLAKPFGARILAATSDGQLKVDEGARTLVPGFGDPDATIPEKSFSTRDEASLATFLSQADVLVVSAPVTPGTRKLLDAKRLAQMKKGSLLINVGRGEIVDIDALTALLEKGHLYGAALDVTDPEPLPEGHRLWRMDNVRITPHIAGATEKYLPRSVDIWLRNADRFQEGKQLYNQVDMKRGY